jgi:hypothetical protein
MERVVDAAKRLHSYGDDWTKKKERSASPAKKADHCRYSWQGLPERFA